MTFILTVPGFLKQKIEEHLKNHSMIDSVVDCNIEHEIHLNVNKRFQHVTTEDLFHANVMLLRDIMFEAFLGEHSHNKDSQEEILELFSGMKSLGNCFFRDLEICNVFPSVRSMEILLQLGLDEEEALLLIVLNKRINDPTQQKELKILVEFILNKGEKAEKVDFLYKEFPSLAHILPNHPILGPIVKNAQASGLKKYAEFLEYLPNDIEYDPIAFVHSICHFF